ncbi:NADH:flavin oxidoreductase/NADH oxidase [Weeksella virosa]|uniref:NADPH dehydrogenase n=1 Tax=Weeksella virosa (strain ATCC 43766 / DSM 16922 / JCM 21250 / CCUG 30538 / CDC 9751 / IAM 14551 / NBRC 16016 / NCTC 11634 / CL345/78) TaxID=865938 RepID=F0P1W0_WEEVC|nr:NADH:flavin oxidoreductase/NADH oxidase [Weeksella virosa]ADX68757.1 NADPH dehydrogenase [Weeksella virosa DSM 16922]VEH63572.1 NADPH dehydrogenase [Weeksella virosa]
MSKLFTSLKINAQLTLKNRIVVSPMCQYSAVDGFATPWHLVYLGSRAVGGAAAIIQEATAITPEGRISYADLGLWSDAQVENLKGITSFIKKHDAIAGIQLAHAGRKASSELPWKDVKQLTPNDKNGWQTVAPSAVPFYKNDYPPVELSTPQIKELVQYFTDAARRAVEAGYEIIEIHAAHGYLIHQFLSPLVNFRSDEYGGSFENRIRFLLEILEAVKKELSTQSLWVRISATDWAEGGWDLHQSIELAKILPEYGVEVIDVSSGGAVHEQKIKVEKNYQVPFAEAIKKSTSILTACVGLIDEAEQAEDILQENKADIVMMGRELLRNPYFPIQAADILGATVDWPKQYLRAKNQK